MEMSDQSKTILLDCDVISHFTVNNCLTDLPVILAPHKCVVLDFVYNEATKQTHYKVILDQLIGSRAIRYMKFPDSDLVIKEEFALIKKKNYLIGDGERACMALAKYKKWLFGENVPSLKKLLWQN